MLCKASQGIYKEDNINNIYGHRFVEGNLSETRCIETCWVCLWMFFVLNRFEDVESRNIHRSFVGWTGTELSFVQLSSSPRLRPLGRRPRENRLRPNAAPPGGGQRPRRGCRAFALDRCRGRRQGLLRPGASKWWEAGAEIESPIWGTSEGFSGLKFMDFAYHGGSQYQRIAASPCQCCCIVGLKLPDCSRICSSDEREIADVARGNERQ